MQIDRVKRDMTTIFAVYDPESGKASVEKGACDVPTLVNKYVLNVQDGQCRGMIVDFSDLKNDLKNLADSFDHAFIYEKGSLKESTVAALKDENFRLIEVDYRPTAENFSKYFYDIMQSKGYKVRTLTVYETPNNCASYCGKD